MLFLGIETSCDETAAALVEETGLASRPWRIRANVVASQHDIHREWGGVVPELASRQHVRDICGVVERALEQGRVTLDAVDAVAVTQGPGLVGSLLVGVSFAKSLAAARGFRSCRSTIWPDTSSRSSCTTARCPCQPWCWSSRAATRVSIWCLRRAATSCWDARETMRRGRRTTRSPSSSALDTPEVRPSTVLHSTATTGPWTCP